MSSRLPIPSVLVVTDRRQLVGGTAAMVKMADAVFASGVRWISLREKDLPADEQITLTRDLKHRAMHYDALISVHGSPEIALKAGADGVHLPEYGDVAVARALMGERALIGQSVHDISQVEAVDPQIVDYLIVGPAFTTLSKPGYGPTLGADGLKAIADASRVPVIAIGGIDMLTAPICIKAGMAGVAVMGEVMRSHDRKRFLADLLQTLDK